jgi:hypothetical protein
MPLSALCTNFPPSSASFLPLIDLRNAGRKCLGKKCLGENLGEKDDQHILTGVQGTHYRPCSSIEVKLLQTRDRSFTWGSPLAREVMRQRLRGQLSWAWLTADFVFEEVPV